VNEVRVAVGSRGDRKRAEHSLEGVRDRIQALQAAGKTVMVVVRDAAPAGLMAVSDPLSPIPRRQSGQLHDWG